MILFPRCHEKPGFWNQYHNDFLPSNFLQNTEISLCSTEKASNINKIFKRYFHCLLVIFLDLTLKILAKTPTRSNIYLNLPKPFLRWVFGQYTVWSWETHDGALYSIWVSETVLSDVYKRFEQKTLRSGPERHWESLRKHTWCKKWLINSEKPRASKLMIL